MAKCIKLTNGTVQRVSKDEAERIVRSGRGEYISKSDWRRLTNAGPK